MEVEWAARPTRPILELGAIGNGGVKKDHLAIALSVLSIKNDNRSIRDVAMANRGPIGVCWCLMSGSITKRQAPSLPFRRFGLAIRSAPHERVGVSQEVSRDMSCESDQLNNCQQE